MGHVGMMELDRRRAAPNGNRLAAIRQQRRAVRKRRMDLQALNMGGLGQFIPTARQARSMGLPRQQIAEGYRYAFPTQIESAFLRTRGAERGVELREGHGGYYTGDPAGANAWNALWAKLYPQVQTQPSPWTNPWSAQRSWGGVGPAGSQLPIYGEQGWSTSSFSPPQGYGGFVAPVANQYGQFPIPGQAQERF